MKKRLILILFSFVFSNTITSTVFSDSITRSDAISERIKADSLFLESIRQRELGNDSIAFEILLDAYSIDTASSAILSELSMYYLADGEDELALETLREANRISPEIIDCKIALANLESAFGNVGEAIALYDEIAKKRPYNPANIADWYRLLPFALRQNNPDNIIHICNMLISMQSDVPDFYFHKGSALYMKKNYRQALTVLNEGISYISTDNTPLVSLFYGQIGDLYYQLGNKKEAYNAYDKALEYNENNILVLNNYSYFLSLDNKELDRAEQMCGRCIIAQPNNSTYLDTYAWIFFKKGNLAKAKLYIENAVRNGGGESADILAHYGDILFKAGNTEKAVEQWTKALEIKTEDGETDTKNLKRKIKKKKYFEE
jgi:tetratricopeptide (TPR) repeat protein